MMAGFNQDERVHLTETLATGNSERDFLLHAPVKNISFDDSDDIVGAACLPSRPGTYHQRRPIIYNIFVCKNPAAEIAESLY